MQGRLTDEDVRSIVRLLSMVCEVEGGRIAQVRALMGGLSRLVSAGYWAWGRGVELYPGSLPKWILTACGGFDQSGMAKLLKAQEHPDMATLTAPFARLLAEKGGQVTRLRQQTDPDDHFSKSGAYQFWADAGIAPGILSCRPIDETSVSVAAIYRRMDEPRFTARESKIAHIVLTEVSWLHDHPDEARQRERLAALSPRERTVLNLLALGYPRKQVADNLGLSLHTINDYTKHLYRTFGVHSQQELMARFYTGDGGDGDFDPQI
ncbi:MAG: hypothetical protein Fur0032_08770 [Terrimicrobiaceae bacterium]